MLHTITFDATNLNEYQRGLISGIMYMATGMPEQTPAWARSHDYMQWYKDLDCTDEQFSTVVETIKNMMHGVILKAE